MAEDKPYNEEILNGLRLCALLLEVGTETVRTLFDKNVKKAAKSLPSLLQQKQREMQHYAKGTGGKPKLLTQEQYAKMYLGKKQAKTSEKFDLTLLILLNSILCNMPKPGTGWSKEPNPRNTTPSADLVRLRLLRNKMYGHTFSLKISSDEYMENWSALTEVLIRLGANKEHCETYQTAYFEPEQINNMKVELYHCIAQDISQLELLCSKLVQRFEDAIQENMISVSEEMNQYMDELKQRDKDNLEMCTCTLSSIVNQIEAHGILYETLVGKTSFQLKNITKCVHSVAAKQDKMMSSVSTNQEKMLQKQEEIKTAVANLHTTKNLLQNTDNPRLTEICQLLSGIKEYFKMLIINAPDQKTDTADVEELAKALGSIDWDIIVDLDHNSRCSGVHDKLAKILHRHKDFSVLTYKDLRTVKDDVKNNVARGNHCIYILANGCSETPECEAILDKFGKATFVISRMLDDILLKMQEAKPLICMILFLSGIGINAVGDLQGRLNDVIESNEEIIAAGKSVYICVDVQESVVDQSFYTKGSVKIVHAKARYSALCQVLFSISPGVYDDKNYIFPDISGNGAHLRKKDIAPILPFLDLYHKTIGEIDFEKMTPNEQEERQKAIQITYHKGGVLTSEGLCLSAKSQVYVRRKEVGAVLKLVETKFNETPWRELHKQPFVIEHDASGVEAPWQGLFYMSSAVNIHVLL